MSQDCFIHFVVNMADEPSCRTHLNDSSYSCRGCARLSNAPALPPPDAGAKPLSWSAAPRVN